MPGDGLPFPVRVGGQQHTVRLGGRLFQLFNQLLLSLDNAVFGLKIIFHVHAEAGFGQVPHMAVGGHHLIALAQIFLNGLRLGRRLHNHQFRHASVTLLFPPPPYRRRFCNPARPDRPPGGYPFYNTPAGSVCQIKICKKAPDRPMGFFAKKGALVLTSCGSACPGRTGTGPAAPALSTAPAVSRRAGRCTLPAGPQSGDALPGR